MLNGAFSKAPSPSSRNYEISNIPPSGGLDSPMDTDNSIIVLDDDDEDEAAVLPGPSHPPPNRASPQAEAPGSSQPHEARGNSSSGGKKCYKLENEKLFEQVSFRGEDSCTPGRGVADWLSVLSFPLIPPCLLSLNPLPCLFPLPSSPKPSSSLNCVRRRQQTTLMWSHSSINGSSVPTLCFWPQRSSATSSLESCLGPRADQLSSMCTLMSSALFSKLTQPRKN